MWKLSVLVCVVMLIVMQADAQQLEMNFDNNSLSGWSESNLGHWHTDTVNPIHGNASLHHCYNDDNAGYDAISYCHDILHLDSLETMWRLTVRHGYNPSASNNWAFWLASDNDAVNLDGEGTCSGYVLGVNYVGSDDYLKLWYKKGGKIEEVVSTDLNWQENVSTDQPVCIKITRSETGVWDVFYHFLQQEDWHYAGEGLNTDFRKSRFIGITYNYTSAQDQKLWVDDIFVHGYFAKDLLPPVIDTFVVIDNKDVEIYFDEPIDTATDIAYRLNKRYFPDTYTWKDTKTVKLTFGNSFLESNFLELFGLTDMSGNVSDLQSFVFDFYIPRKYDVIIAEILADPIPSVGLPECEYIELANLCAHEIDLTGWELVVGEDEVSLTDIVVPADNNIVLCNKSCQLKFAGRNNVYGISGFPSLSNTGETIQIIDARNTIMHAVHYKNQWYASSMKEEGGWSLEMIDTGNPCVEEGNWAESIATSGGTPGAPNSVTGKISDTTSPYVNYSFITETGDLQINFSENMDSLSITNVNNYNTGGLVVNKSPMAGVPLFNTIQMAFTTGLNENQVYQLKLDPEITDCSGNSIRAENIYFGIPQIADSSDLIVNEILFESTEEIPEFIELYNNSTKIIDLKNYAIGIYDDFSGTYSKISLFTFEPIYIFPQGYKVITSDKSVLCHYFGISDMRNVLQADNWNTLKNEGGKIALIAPSGRIIDEAVYNPSMHFSLLSETTGASLERISADLSGINTSNWHSASSTSNYATPGIPNSQHYVIDPSSHLFTLNSDQISPDNDGINDILTITYAFNKPGYLISVFIYNSMGEYIATSANNELAGITGSYFWGGTDDMGHLQPMGYYIVLCQALHPDGDQVKEKKTVLLLPQKNSPFR
jgi:hypothetical protein